MNLFRKILNYIKWPFRRLAVIVVTAWADKLFRDGVAMADKRHKAEGDTIYLAARLFRTDLMTTYNRDEFRAFKRACGQKARLMTTTTLKNGCYYHTADKAGNNAMSERDKEIRRRFFIKERLTLAKLI